MLKAPTDWYDAYIFDLDGTIYLGDGLLPGAKRLIEGLRANGKVVKFLSNNPTKDPHMYQEKLERLGLPTSLDDIANTVVTTTRWLTDHHPDAKLFVIGEEPLQRALRGAGFTLTDDPEQIDIVISSYDRGFDYHKLQIAFDAIWFHKRAFLIETNPDRFCPFPGGRGEPDCASITAAIEACTRTKCVKSLGKPDPIMLQVTMEGLDARVEHSVMVGDRLQTDIQMALDTGMGSACVLTGEATADDIRALDDDHRPTWVLDRIDKLIPASAWAELGWTENDD